MVLVGHSDSQWYGKSGAAIWPQRFGGHTRERDAGDTDIGGGFRAGLSCDCSGPGVEES